MTGTMEEYRGTLEMLREMDAELKLVIAGNHDLSLHESYYRTESMAQNIQGTQWNEDTAHQAQELWTGPEAQTAGVTYLTEGLHTFDLSNGGRFTIYASAWQPEFYNWAFNYPHHEDRWNPPHLVDPAPFGPSKKAVIAAPPERDPHPLAENTKVDIIMTHGPPWMHLDECAADGNRAGCPHLLRMLDLVRPQVHCFGHIHEGWGAERIAWKDGDIVGPGNVGESTETVGCIVAAKGSGVQTPNDPNVIARRAAYTDISSGSSRPLEVGRETLLVNSSIKDLNYNSENAGWLVDLDLPLRQV